MSLWISGSEQPNGDAIDQGGLAEQQEGSRRLGFSCCLEAEAEALYKHFQDAGKYQAICLIVHGLEDDLCDP